MAGGRGFDYESGLVAETVEAAGGGEEDEDAAEAEDVAAEAEADAALLIEP